MGPLVFIFVVLTVVLVVWIISLYTTIKEETADARHWFDKYNLETDKLMKLHNSVSKLEQTLKEERSHWFTETEKFRNQKLETERTICELAKNILFLCNCQESKKVE